jgi:hypothetical protein
MGSLFLSLLQFALSVVSVLFRGFVIKTYWAWFIITLFPSLPTLTLMGAVGLSFCVGIMAPMKSLSQEEWDELRASDSEDRTKLSLLNTGLHIFGCGMALLGGYIWHLFM